MFIGFNAINRIFCIKFVYIKLRKLICLKNFCTTFSNIHNMLCTVCSHKIVPGEKCFPRIIIKKNIFLNFVGIIRYESESPSLLLLFLSFQVFSMTVLLQLLVKKVIAPLFFFYFFHSCSLA